MREVTIERNTNETQIELTLNLDGAGRYQVDTGCGFLNHMLELFARHGRFDLVLTCHGDVEVDYHHTTEDVGIALGQAFAQARAFLEAGAKNLHVVDLDGAKDGTLSNYDTIAALAKQGGLYIEVGGGIRTEERIEKYLSLGVGRCILGSVAVTNFDFTARMLKKYGEKIAVGVDAKGGYVAIHGWKDVSAEPGVAFCQRLAEAGCKAIIYTDIACDGAMKGTNLALYRQLAKEVPGVAITASGGISSEKELLELEEMGTAAAILGKSLYTGALDLGRCVALVQK